MSAVSPSLPEDIQRSHHLAENKVNPAIDDIHRPLSPGNNKINSSIEMQALPAAISDLLTGEIEIPSLSHNISSLPIAKISNETLEAAAKQISDEIQVANFLEQKDLTLSIQSYIEENGSEIVSNLLKELKESDVVADSLNHSETTLNATQTMSNTFLSTLIFASQSASDTIDFLRIKSGDFTLGADALHGLKGLEVGTTMLKLLGAAGSAVVVQALIAQANKEIEIKKGMLSHTEGAEKEKLEKEIHTLTHWVKLHHYTLADQLKETAIATFLAFPRIGHAICGILEQGSSTVGIMFGGFTRGVALAGSIYEWYKTVKDLSKEKKWSEAFRNQGSQEHAKKLLEKQEAIYTKKREKIQADVHAIIDPLKDQPVLPPEEEKKAVENALEQLKKLGFNLEPDPRLPDSGIDLSQATSRSQLYNLLQTPQAQNEIHRQSEVVIGKSEMLSVSLRNALKTFLLKKSEIERGFLSWELLKNKVNVVAAVITTGLWIALKVAAISGAAAGMVASGYGMIALAAILAVAGLAYFYYKKPNVFVTMCKGVHAELALRKLPLAIQQYRRQSALLDILKAAENSQAVMSQILILKKIDKTMTFENMPEGFKVFLQKKTEKQADFSPGEIEQNLMEYTLELEKQHLEHKQKMEVLNKHVLELNESVERQEKVVNDLQGKIVEAGWKDYQRLLHKDKAKLPDHSTPSAKASSVQPEDDADVFASFILSDEGLLHDPDTVSVLAQMNIDLQVLRTMHPDEAKKEAATLIQTFFSMDDRELLDAIRQHRRKVKIASL